MSESATFDRRELSLALSQAARASVADILSAPPAPPNRGARRIGVTGPPGAGKSSLIGKLIHHRLAHARLLAVIAIDPSSPNSRGSVLGDRLRMDELFDHPRLYIRSLPSRQAHDGLTENLPEILATLDRFGFDEVIVETVGVGQAEYGVRAFVDTEVLVLVPDAGDHVQAMKCGILETADVYVVNKADLAGAERIAAEVRGVFSARAQAGREPPVLLTHRNDATAITAIDEAIEDHLTQAVATRDDNAVQRLRRRLRVQSLIQRQVANLMESTAQEEFDRPLAGIYRDVLARLADAAF